MTPLLEGTIPSREEAAGQAPLHHWREEHTLPSRPEQLLEYNLTQSEPLVPVVPPQGWLARLSQRGTAEAFWSSMKPFPSESDPAGQDERWIEVEALPPKENRRTMSSIHEAASRGDLEELSRLLSQDPGLVHHRDRRFHDCTPLCQAVIRGQLQAVQLLIDHGADVNAGVTRRGAGTVLVQACAHGNRDVALLLLARGADPVKDDSSRAGALKAAAYGGDEEIVRALLRSGVCDVDGCSGNGRSALWKACCHGHQGAARALLTEGGADPGVCDKDGKTPKDIATERGHHGCVQLLQWFEGELERAVLLAKARRLAEDVPAIQQAPGRAGANLTAQQVQRARCRAAPPYLRRRVETGDMEMPSMQVIGGAGQQEGEEEEEGSAVSSSGTRTREVLRWVVEGMRDDPWADLMHLLGPTTHSHANTISSSRTTTGR